MSLVSTTWWWSRKLMNKADSYPPIKVVEKKLSPITVDVTMYSEACTYKIRPESNRLNTLITTHLLNSHGYFLLTGDTHNITKTKNCLWNIFHTNWSHYTTTFLKNIFLRAELSCLTAFAYICPFGFPLARGNCWKIDKGLLQCSHVDSRYQLGSIFKWCLV